MKREDMLKDRCSAENWLWDCEHGDYLEKKPTLKVIDGIKSEMFARGVKYANRWINTDEALPKNTKPVLVKGETPSGGKTIQVGRLYKSGWVTDTYFKVDVKEWKPID